MKKLFFLETLYIKDGEMLEEVKDRFHQLGYPVIWGYNLDDYKEHESVSHGFLHYDYDDNMFFLAKSHYDKAIMFYEDFKAMEITPKKPRSKTKKRYSENDLKEAMEYGLDYGYQSGLTDGMSEEGTTSELDYTEIFEDWKNDNNK